MQLYLANESFTAFIMNIHGISTNQIKQIVAEHDTPVFIYNADNIRTRIKQLKEVVGKYHKSDFYYAIKANYNPHIVRIIAEQGIGIDAVSLNEVKLALYAGVPNTRILYTENNITTQQMKEAHALGVLINVGSLSRLRKFGKAFPGSNVCVRFNPNVGMASHETNITGGPDSKFGVSYKDVEEVKQIVEEFNLKLVGIHQHIGSGWLRTEEPLIALDVILDLAKQFDSLEFVDLGGGFGIPYQEDQGELDIEMLGNIINERFTAFCKDYGRDLVLRFEPGRWFVQEALLVAEVNTVKKTISGRNVAGTDTGMNHLIRPAFYGSYHPLHNISNPQGKKLPYDVVGNICEFADYFAKDRLLPEFHEGDLLGIGMAGAYGMSMASNYQFWGLPAEVLIDGDDVRLIRQRENFEDLLHPFPPLG